MGKQKNKRTSSGFVMINENIETLVSFWIFHSLDFFTILLNRDSEAINKIAEMIPEISGEK